MGRNPTKKVLIVGANGQDGRLLTQISLQHGYAVTGVARSNPSSNFDSSGFELLVKNFVDEDECLRTLNNVNPNLIFHVAAAHANSSDMASFQEKHSSEIFDTSCTIARNILLWQRSNLHSKSVIALSSHLYSGISGEHLVNEECHISPTTDYGRAKAEAYSHIKINRSTYGVKSSAAILFNHTSINGRSDFVYPILANQIRDVILDRSREIRIRNFDAQIDITDARDICEGMFKLANLHSSVDFVLGSGESNSIRAITNEALRILGVSNSVDLVSTESNPKTGATLVSDIRKANRMIDWTPKVDAVALLVMLVREQLKQQNV